MNAQEKLEKFCKKWGLSESHLNDLMGIFKESEKGTVKVGVPEDCEFVLLGYMKGKDVINTATLETKTGILHQA